MSASFFDGITAAATQAWSNAQAASNAIPTDGKDPAALTAASIRFQIAANQAETITRLASSTVEKVHNAATAIAQIR